ncbi:hypothetical protein ABT168_03215 [Streptomyces sp. NPDC001793]|uniref:hypothetical protein n=1 Tax=Streptomyces sp. NPDC001793 TaxID=3154657 RepID=UPI00332FE9F5
MSGLLRGEAFRPLAGMLLFEMAAGQQRFDRNTRRRRAVPIDGWCMEHLRTSADKAATTTGRSVA